MTDPLVACGYTRVGNGVYLKTVKDELQDESIDFMLIGVADSSFGGDHRPMYFVADIGDVRLQTRPFALSADRLVEQYEKPFTSLVFATLTHLLALPHNTNIEDSTDGL